MNWTPGEHKTRDGRRVILKGIDGPGDYPLYGYVQEPDESWWGRTFNSKGEARYCASGDSDLMPPTITREALADECVNKFGWPQPLSVNQQAMAIVAHVIEAVKSGRVE